MKRLLVLTLAFAGATAAAGWWTVPVVAAVWVRGFPRARSPVRSCVAGAVIGWALLLAWVMLHGPAATVGDSASVQRVLMTMSPSRKAKPAHRALSSSEDR